MLLEDTQMTIEQESTQIQMTVKEEDTMMIIEKNSTQEVISQHESQSIILKFLEFSFFKYWFDIIIFYKAKKKLRKLRDKSIHIFC